VFIFDIDDTICETDEAFVTISQILSFLESTDEEIQNRSFIHFADCGMMTEKEEEKVIKFLNIAQIWENLNIFRGASSLIREIVSKGHYLVYLTKREDGLRDQTEKWFEKQGLPKPVDSSLDIYNLDQKVTLVTNGRCKAEGLRNIVDHHDGREIYYFENDPKYVLTGSELGIPNIFTFDYGYNKDVSFGDEVTILDNPRNGCLCDLAETLDL
jgi:uncharacterized HAD superfamily protein